MKTRQGRECLVIAAATVLLLLGGGVAAGCGPRNGDDSRNTRTDTTTKHGHAASHGGVVVSVGERHHVEAVWDAATGRVQVFVLGADETVSFPISAQSLTATLPAANGQSGEQTVTLQANPLPGEAAGSFASRFEAAVPGTTGPPQSLTVALPLDGTEHRVRFGPLIAAAATAGTNPADGGHHEATGTGSRAAAAPSTMTTTTTTMTAHERNLFLSSGGLYTDADIVANARQVPAQRYRGMMASHNQRPPKGARICPISGTQANSKFAWVIGGKRYLFCCPPCIEEFVQQAKERPASIRAPQDYVKKD